VDLWLKSADGDAMMIQCDKCNVWQHGPCVGIWADEEAPDGTSMSWPSYPESGAYSDAEYFCEQCRPELHGPLKRWIRSRGRNMYVNSALLANLKVILTAS
jgi:hypothetical protein